MAKYQVSESDYLKAKDIQGVDGLILEILSEVVDTATEYGIKAKCRVRISNRYESHEKNWTLNKQNINFLVKNFGGESKDWIGKQVGVSTETIKGNLAIRIKEVS